MPTASLADGLLSSPRLLAGDQGVIKMPQQAIEMQEVGSSANSDASPSDTVPGVRSPKGKPRRVSACRSCIFTISNDNGPPVLTQFSLFCLQSTSAFTLVTPKRESDLTSGEAFMLKFSRMSTHLGARAHLSFTILQTMSSPHVRALRVRQQTSVRCSRGCAPVLRSFRLAWHLRRLTSSRTTWFPSRL